MDAVLFDCEQFSNVVCAAGGFNHIVENVDNDAFLSVLIFNCLIYCEHFGYSLACCL